MQFSSDASAGLVIALAVLLSHATAFADERLAVVTHAERRGELRTEDVARIYLRQRRFWPDGSPILPVNRNARSGERELFTRLVFGEGSRDLRNYWNRLYFQGVLPPPTLASEEAVLRFVAVERNAIGYVRATRVDDSVRVLLYLGPP